MFFRAVTTPLMTPVPNFNKWCAVSNFLFKNIDFCIFTPKTPLVKENYFLTLWNFTYLKDTSFGKKSCKFEHGLETKNEFEKWPLITFFQCIYCLQMFGCHLLLLFKKHQLLSTHCYHNENTPKLIFLAHLSRRLTGELIVYPCSVVRPSVVHNFKDLLL